MQNIQKFEIKLDGEHLDTTSIDNIEVLLDFHLEELVLKNLSGYNLHFDVIEKNTLNVVGIPKNSIMPYPKTLHVLKINKL